MKILSIDQVNEGVEILCEEERGVSRRTFVYSVIINQEDFNKIKEFFPEGTGNE